MTINASSYVTIHSFHETMQWHICREKRALIVIDLYEPGESVRVFAGRFLEELNKRNLGVERIVPLHGKIVPCKAGELACVNEEKMIIVEASLALPARRSTRRIRKPILFQRRGIGDESVTSRQSSDCAYTRLGDVSREVMMGRPC